VVSSKEEPPGPGQSTISEIKRKAHEGQINKKSLLMETLFGVPEGFRTLNIYSHSVALCR